MRPIRLRLEGFASFVEAEEIDFTDADVFVLSGPTGAGKSSVIDAMVFALYGSVPRYDNLNLVHPVIAQSAQEARVALTFEVAGELYTAARIVRRTKTGATTKEARLERWTSPDGSTTASLAETQEELTEQVERLLGLKFEHFTSCVVLPQGSFQAFLHAKGQQRQELLIQLLDLELYRNIASAARQRAAAAAARATSLREDLDGRLTDATDDQRRAAATRVDQLARLADELDIVLPQLEGLTETGTAQAAVAEQATRQVELLDGVTVPADATSLSEANQRAQDALDTARDALEAAVAAVETATTTAENSAPVGELRQQVERLDQLEATTASLAAATDQATRASQDVDDLLEEVRRATAAVTSCDEALEAARRSDLAAALRQGLHAGDDCPVCSQRVDSVPTHDSDDIDAARAARDEAAAQRERLATRLDEARRSAATTHGQVETLQHRLQELTSARDDSPLPDDRDSLTQLITASESVARDLAAARQAESAARAEHRQAEAAAREAAQRADRAWDTFHGAWSSVAELGPPPPDRADLAGSWTQLTTWIEQQRPVLQQAATQAQGEVSRTREQFKALAGALQDSFETAGVAWADPSRAATNLSVAQERARAALESVQQKIDEADRVRKELAEATRTEQVGRLLGQQLNAKGFERWLLERALRHLVVGATRELRELSDGAYSLTLDERSNFQIIDHRNADQARPVRTLSGGETFLASLSLALALSEHVADLAANGAARLDTLILDEGFGTLDASTLDVVAAALQNLGAQGRMVGVITHVADLAEQLPVRYEVRKEAGTSHVTRAAG